MNPFVPSWVHPGAKVDLDFANGRYWGGSIDNEPIPPVTTLVGMDNGPGVTAYVPDNLGIIHVLPYYSLRIAPGTGLWVTNTGPCYALWSRDFTQSPWTKVNVTANMNQLGADLSINGATLLTATASLGTVLQSITLVSTKIVSSAYIKRVSGVGTISMTQDGINYTDITSQLSTSKYTWVKIPNQTVANPVVGFKFGTNGDSIAVDFFQTEGGSYATPPYPNQGSAITYNQSDEPAFGSPGGSHPNAGYAMIYNIMDSGKPWSCAATISGYGGSGTAAATLISDGNVSILGAADGSTLSFQGATTSNTGNLGGINKIAGSVTGAGSYACLNGGPISPVGTNPAYSYPQLNGGISHCGIGNNGSGGAALNGFISRLALWDKELTTGEMIEYTQANSLY